MKVIFCVCVPAAWAYRRPHVNQVKLGRVSVRQQVGRELASQHAQLCASFVRSVGFGGCGVEMCGFKRTALLLGVVLFPSECGCVRYMIHAGKDEATTTTPRQVSTPPSSIRWSPAHGPLSSIWFSNAGNSIRLLSVRSMGTSPGVGGIEVGGGWSVVGARRRPTTHIG